MEPAVRSPWIESAINGPGSKRCAFGRPRLPKFPAADRHWAVENPAAGNGTFGCRDGTPKSDMRDRKRNRRPKERNDTGGNPHRNGLSRVGAGICGFVGLDGGVRSHMRTGLYWNFPVIREFNREFFDFRPFEAKCPAGNPTAAATSRIIPYDEEQGISRSISGNLRFTSGSFYSACPANRVQPSGRAGNKQ
jgi:hypothetical protein